jgi:hypothetical protein
LYNILVAWETGETIYDSIDLIAQVYPVSCAEYANKHRRLNSPGWKRSKRLRQNEKKIEHMINQAKLTSYRLDVFWMFGVLAPRNHAQAWELIASMAIRSGKNQRRQICTSLGIDSKHGNTKWQESEKTEIE